MTPWLTTFPARTREPGSVPSQEQDALTRIAGAPVVTVTQRRRADDGHRTRTDRRPGWFLGEWAADADGAA